MVLQGQDAWRRNPLISGLWKKPLPHLPLAIGLFATYCAAEYVFDKAMALPEGPKKAVPTVKFWRDADTGIDEEPQRKVIKGGH